MHLQLFLVILLTGRDWKTNGSNNEDPDDDNDDDVDDDNGNSGGGNGDTGRNENRRESSLEVDFRGRSLHATNIRGSTRRRWQVRLHRGQQTWQNYMQR